MASKNPKWVGTKEIQETKSSPVFENTPQGPKYTRTFRGPLATLQSNQPARLSEMPGFGGYFVDVVRIEPEGGGAGMMTITLTPAPIPDYTFAENQVLEVDWVVVERKIDSHPAFHPPSSNNQGPNAGNYALTDADWSVIAQWRTAAPGSGADGIYSGASPHAKAFLDLLKRGTDSYDVFAPVVRRTTQHATSPATARCGFVSTPPIPVPGYVFLKTGDRATRNRTWTRTEEWTGAHFIDPILYA